MIVTHWIKSLAAACAVATGAGGASAKSAAEPSGPHRFECDIALMVMPQRQFTAPTPVTISFVADRGALRDIRVVDEGGILFPGGNLKIVQKPDATSMEAVAMPAERPGRWSGTIEKKSYRLKLTSGAIEEAVTIGLGRTPSKGSGRYGLVWNATNLPEGLPKPISGTGGGNCALRPALEAKR
ncbi:MAG TPA: hypothetical protein VE053_03475 [Allosphingosinicella sp.]|nr:hypothetical protein [Allosphingosinicella sp.]